jgi:hypothetical protein
MRRFIHNKNRMYLRRFGAGLGVLGGVIQFFSNLDDINELSWGLLSSFFACVLGLIDEAITSRVDAFA